MWEQLGEEVGRQWGEDLSKRPFRRVGWFSKVWVADIELGSPLSPENPLWTRSTEELQEVRLFGYRPEELKEKLVGYCHKPWWKRWFIFGITRQIDIWGYYQSCLVYQAVYTKSSDRFEPEVMTNKALMIDQRLILFKAVVEALYQWHREFEYNLTRDFRRKNWFWFKPYQKDLRKRILKVIERELKDMPGEEQGWVDQGYEAVNRHYEHCLKKIECLEGGAQEQKSIECLQVSESQEITEVELAPAPTRNVSVKKAEREGCLSTQDGGKVWLESRRWELGRLLREERVSGEASLEVFLERSFVEIRDFIEIHFRNYGIVLNNLNRRDPNYREGIETLEQFYRQLKQLLQNGMRLFHPDRVLRLVRSDSSSWQLLSEYAQKYIKANRVYLGRLKQYQERFEAQVSHSEASCSFEKERRAHTAWLAYFTKQLTAFEVRLAESDAARAREKAESDAARAREKAEFEAKLAESDAARARERAEFEAKLAESDAARAREKAESDAARAREKAELEAKLVENNVARVRDREELETKLVDFSEFFLMKLKENQGRGVPPTLGEGAVGTQPAFFKVSSATERVASKELGSERELRQCGNSWEKR